MMSRQAIIGLLLAAGRGRRMGGNKQFHVVPTPDGDKPLVAAAFDTIASACDTMCVVVGHRADEVAAVLAPRQFEIVMANADSSMIDSIKAGLRSILSQTRSSTRSDGWRSGQSSILLQLGDHPALEHATLDQLLAVAVQHSDKAVMPTHHGLGGHPVLIPVAITRQILDADCPGGLRQFWLDRPKLAVRIEVDDPSVVQNINTS